MGRATHNRHTQAKLKDATQFSIQTNDTVLKSLQSLKDTRENSQVPIKTISHIELSEDISTIYKTISAFSTMSQRIVKWYEDNEIIIKNQDQLTCDILHEFELSPPKDLYRAYKCYTKLRQSRQLRRKAKNENKMLAPLYGYIKSNPTMPKDIKNICEKCAGIQYDIQNAKYTFKSDEVID